MSNITIGMPVFNGAATIERAIASIEAQINSDFNVIVADNGSTDGSWEILKAWADRDSRVNLHRHSENIGLFANFRYVLDRAETGYFIWHACDDWLSPDYLSALSAVLDRDPDCALACADATRMADENSPKPGKAARPAPDLAHRGRRGRIMAMLVRPQAVWLYGLFRTERLRAVQQDAADFGHIWSSDRLMLLPLMLNDAIRSSSRAHFYSRATGSSGPLYTPYSITARLCFAARYIGFNIRLFYNSALSPLDKFFLFPGLLWHGVITCHSGFYKFYIKRPFRKFFG